MRFSSILVLVVSIGLGFAAGAYFAPEALRHLQPASDDSSSSSGNAIPSGASVTSTQPTGEAGGDLASILKETDPYRQLKELTAYAENLKAEDIPEAIRQVKSNQSVDNDSSSMISRKSQVFSILINRWVELDPPSLMEWLQKKENSAGGSSIQLGPGSTMGNPNNVLVSLAYSALAAHDPTAVLSEIRQMPEGSPRDAAIQAVVEKVAQQDPAQALQIIKGIKSYPGQYGGTILTIFSQWALKDPVAAGRAAYQLPDEQLRTNAITALAGSLTRKDPQAALAWVNQLPQGKMRRDAQGTVIDQWAFTDPQAALAWTENLPPALEKNSGHESALEKLSAQQKIFENWSNNDPQGAASYAEALPAGDMKDEMMPSVVGALARADIHAALDLIDKLPPGKSKESAQQSILNSWVPSDPQAVLAYGQALPTGTVRNNFIEAAATQMFRSDPSSAVDWLRKLPDDAERNRLLSTNGLTWNWAANDIDSAAAYASTLLPGQSTALVNAVANQMAQKDPAKAFAWASRLKDGDGKDEAMKVVFSEWEQHDPSAAAQSAANLPDSPQKDNVYSNIAQNWGRSDPVQTTTWLTQLPSSSSRDAAARTFSDQIFSTDPERAVQWAASIGDPKTQQTQVTTLLQKWMQSDPANATVAVQKSSLPDDVKKQVLQVKQ